MWPRAESETIFRASAEWLALQSWQPRPTALGRELGLAQEPRFLPLRLKPRFSIPAKRASIKFAATLAFQRVRLFSGLGPTGLDRACGDAGWDSVLFATVQKILRSGELYPHKNLRRSCTICLDPSVLEQTVGP